MKLYKLLMLTGAPKNSWTNIHSYFVANNDDEAYEHIKPIAGWDYNEDEEKVYEIYDDDYKVVGTETFKEKTIRLKGALDDICWEDAYYGITAYGWEEISNIETSDIETLIRFNILTVT